MLALKLALGDGGKTTDQQGALKTLAQQSFGEILLVLMAIGLFGYALWRLVRAAIGHGAEGDRDDAKERIDGVASGIGYGLLFVTAVSILAGSGGGGGGGPQQASGGVLDWPAGQMLVIIAGLVLLGVAVDQGIKGFKKKFLEKSHTERMNEKVKKAFTAFGVFGHLARMVIFGLMGYFLIKAALDYNPDEAVGLDGALAKLANSAGGPHRPRRGGRRPPRLRPLLVHGRPLPAGLNLGADVAGARAQLEAPAGVRVGADRAGPDVARPGGRGQRVHALGHHHVDVARAAARGEAGERRERIDPHVAGRRAGLDPRRADLQQPDVAGAAARVELGRDDPLRGRRRRPRSAARAACPSAGRRPRRPRRARRRRRGPPAARRSRSRSRTPARARPGSSSR